MDHSEAVRLKATERYLLQELDPDQLEQFEEHFFDCQECALDVRTATMLVEQSKAILSETANAVPVKVAPPVRRPWLAWLRPAFAVPLMAGLLAVIGYQNLLVYPAMKQAASEPYILASASINVATRSGATALVHSRPGDPFVLLLNLPAENRFSSYIADLYDPAGHIKWSVPISAETANDTVPMRIPGQREPGVYTLAVRGVPQAGGSPSEIGRQPFELRLQ
ncbi:MAG: zf-HC2 domain-containing protein [Terriglobales bacterium]